MRRQTTCIGMDETSRRISPGCEVRGYTCVEAVNVRHVLEQYDSVIGSTSALTQKILISKDSSDTAS